jgi:ribonuclease I
VRSEFKPKWEILAPDYLKPTIPKWGGPELTLADHEWRKHGSCVNAVSSHLDLQAGVALEWQRDYFTLQLQLMEDYPTPTQLQDAARNGSTIERSTLQALFGGPTDSVALQCDDGATAGEGRLTMVSMCFSHARGSGEHNRSQPQRVACSKKNCLSTAYSNSCANHTSIHVVGVPIHAEVGDVT